MSHCKHHWTKCTETLRTLFAREPRQSSHDFFVCGKCLRIKEVDPDYVPPATTLRVA